jgi:Lrp/AsnC family leucine-responsive transcriptional regulator
MNQLLDLDRIDRRILAVLTVEGRISWRDLAERVNLTLTPALRRVRKLEASGYIQGYTAVLDAAKLAGGMTVFVSVTLERQVEDILASFEERVAALPEVIGGFMMTGGADYLLHAVVRSLEHYQTLLAELTRMPGVAHIQSSFALKTFVRRASVVPTE